MKSRRRHELKQNVLDAELGKGLEFLKAKGTYLALAVLGVALVVLVVVYVGRKKNIRLDDLQRAYNQAAGEALKAGAGMKPQERLERLKVLADEREDPRLAALACLAVADSYHGQLLANRPKLLDSEARSLAQQAAGFYRRIIDRFGNQRAMAARAHMGLGKLAETQGDFQQAASRYRIVRGMTDLAGYPVVAMAGECLESLKHLKEPIPFATTLPAEATTEPVAEAPPTKSAADGGPGKPPADTGPAGK